MNVVSSGSKGNSTIIWDENDALVVDFGISVKRFKKRYEELNMEEIPISVLITHEHVDHSSQPILYNSIPYDATYSFIRGICTY